MFCWLLSLPAFALRTFAYVSAGGALAWQEVVFAHAAYTAPSLAARLPPCCRAGQAEERVARLEQLAMQLASEQTVLQVRGGTC